MMNDYVVGMKVVVSIAVRVTERMNAVVDAVGGSPSPYSRAAARQMRERVEW